MRTFILRFRAIFALSVAVLVLTSGCSSSDNKVGGALNLDTDLKLNFIVDATINPDDKKRPSPVFVRLYELKSPTVFMKADFIDLFERDKEILGEDFVSKQTLKPLSPDVGRTDELVLKNGAAYVALYVEFSQYRGAVYKLAFPITQHNMTKNEFTVKISGTQISLVSNDEVKKQQKNDQKSQKNKSKSKK